MIVLAVTSRLRRGTRTRHPGSAWERPTQARRFFRNLFDLSMRPANALDFVARCLLLVTFALACHGLGAGVALFLRAAPVFATVIFAALFVCTATNWLSRD